MEVAVNTAVDVAHQYTCVQVCADLIHGCYNHTYSDEESSDPLLNIMVKDKYQEFSFDNHKFVLRF